MVTKEQAINTLKSIDSEYIISSIDYEILEQFIEQSERYKKALELLLESSEECEDQDGWVAFMLSADDYHEAQELYEENENN